ncbi:MAG: SGNH/GDSL hydrolase family protein [Verrucomicrobiota bacterium]|nr:SGNH/GDSL hydrolase family protein [Opitutales bacterium]
MTSTLHPLDQLGPVIRRRSPLTRTQAALARGRLTVGFLGGSISAPQPGYSWPEPLVAWLADTYPAARITVENAALGATGSELAAIRTQTEIIDRGCDLVFVEYAVNDFGTEAGRRARTREGVLRQLRRAPGCDVVIVYTYGPDLQADLFAGRVPPSIADFELLADHYGLSSVWMGLQALQEVQRGLLRWEDWLPDAIHPGARGSLCYAQSVLAYLAEALAPAGDRAAAPAPAELPAPLTPGAWDRVRLVPLGEPAVSGPWTLRRVTTCHGVTQLLVTTAPQAGLTLPFTGRGLVLAFDFGKASGEIRYRVDGGAWQDSVRDCPDWAGAAGWLRPLVLAEGLASGPHRFELQTLAGPGSAGRGSRTAIGLIGVVE